MKQDHRLEVMLRGHAHVGGGSLGRREWWEQVMLRQVKEEAYVFRSLAPDDEWRKQKQRDIKVLGYALAELRRHSRRWALKQIIRVSEALGLYEEDA